MSDWLLSKGIHLIEFVWVAVLLGFFAAFAWPRPAEDHCPCPINAALAAKEPK